MGKGDRAYRVNSHKKNKYYSDRHPDHSKRLQEMMDRGTLPHEWTVFDIIHTTRDKALFVERMMIKNLNPVFNRKGGPQFSLTKEQVLEVFKLREQNKTYDEIAEQFGCSRSTIYRIIRKTRGNYIGR